MDRTKRLLMGVTASALLLGSSEASADLLQPISRAPTREADKLLPRLLKTGQGEEDRKIAEASTIISDLLSNVPEQSAMTLDQLLAKRPDLKRDTAEKAIQKLLEEAKIKKTGEGTQTKPFKYYGRSRYGSGG